jgi:hypothetical protein
LKKFWPLIVLPGGLILAALLFLYLRSKNSAQGAAAPTAPVVVNSGGGSSGSSGGLISLISSVLGGGGGGGGGAGASISGKIPLSDLAKSIFGGAKAFAENFTKWVAPTDLNTQNLLTEFDDSAAKDTINYEQGAATAAEQSTNMAGLDSFDSAGTLDYTKGFQDYSAPALDGTLFEPGDFPPPTAWAIENQTINPSMTVVDSSGSEWTYAPAVQDPYGFDQPNNVLDNTGIFQGSAASIDSIAANGSEEDDLGDYGD